MDQLTIDIIATEKLVNICTGECSSCKERVYCKPKIAELKPGVICEWTFNYPNGQVTADIVASFPINPENFDYDIGIDVCQKKIKDKLWEICGKYSLITGEKL